MRVELGDSDLPQGFLARRFDGHRLVGFGGGHGCQDLLKGGGAAGRADTTDDVAEDSAFARHSFGAQFAEVHVDAVTGEVRVSRPQAT